MEANNAKRGAACVAFMVILFIAFSAQAGESQPTTSTMSLVRDEMIGNRGRGYTERTAEMFAEKYRSEAVPVLIALLKEDIPPAVKAKASFYLGKCHDDQSTTHPGVRPIIDLIECTRKASIGEAEGRMIGDAMCGLGFTKDGAALEFLKSAASRGYWEGCPLQPTGLPNSKFETRESSVNALRAWALRGLGVAGNQRAVNILEEIRLGSASDLAPTVDTWMNHAKRRISGEYLEDRKKYSPIL